MADNKQQPHQDPIHQGLRRPSDGLAAAQLDIEQLYKRIDEISARLSQCVMNAGEGDGILRKEIESLKTRLQLLEDAQDKMHQRMMQLVDQIQALEAK